MKCFIRGYKRKFEVQVQKGKTRQMVKNETDKIKIAAGILTSSKGGVVELPAKQS
jgi:hypothetical protein